MAEKATEKKATKVEEPKKDNIFQKIGNWFKVNWKWLLGIGGGTVAGGLLGFIFGRKSNEGSDVVIQLDEASFDSADDAPTEE